MLVEVLRYLAPKPGGRVLDGTAGAGGHAAALAVRLAPGGTLLVVDRDPLALDLAAARLRGLTPAEATRELEPVEGSPSGHDFAEPLALSCQVPAGEVDVQIQKSDFRDMGRLAGAQGWEPLDGVLLDLGVSSMQLDRAERGFSLMAAGPLDMRMDPQAELSAADVVNGWNQEDLANAIYELGEERSSRRIARAIVEARQRAPLKTTRHLADVVSAAVPFQSRRQGRGRGRASRGPRLHPATRTFQALRLVVNDELGALGEGLAAGWSTLAPGGHMAVIAFHSLEDRIVKRFLREKARAGEAEVLTKRPLRPTEAEVAGNPRARSARLRAAVRCEVNA